MSNGWVKSPQDLGAAIVFVLIGAAGLTFGQELAFGTAAQMGPGYFPMVLSALIMLIGLGLAAASLRIPGPPIQRVQLRPLLLIVAAVLAFGYLLDIVGLVVTTIALTFIAACARPGVRLRETSFLALGLAVFALVVFVYGLSQPLPIGWWPQ